MIYDDCQLMGASTALYHMVGCDDGPRDWTGRGFYKKYVAGLRQGAELGQRCVCGPWDVRQYNSEGVRRSATGWSRMTEMRREMGKMCG